jgi:hypothetical protein
MGKKRDQQNYLVFFANDLTNSRNNELSESLFEHTSILLIITYKMSDGLSITWFRRYVSSQL